MMQYTSSTFYQMENCVELSFFDRRINRKMLLRVIEIVKNYRYVQKAGKIEKN